MSYIAQSNLEDLRRKRYGIDSAVRLLKKGATGYVIIASLTKNWFVGRQFDTSVGAYVVKLTMDRPEGITPWTVRDWVFADVIHPDGSFDRYRLSAETKPNTMEPRWVVQLTAAFNDTTAIEGVITPVPPPDPPSAFLTVLNPFVHTQSAPAAEWIVNHNLGHWPIIEVFTSGGELIEADILNMTVNQLRVYFATPTAGSVRCV